jgi:hypothetical protein
MNSGKIIDKSTKKLPLEKGKNFIYFEEGLVSIISKFLDNLSELERNLK